LKLRILHKGLLLIFVPLLLQLWFFAQLFNLVSQVEVLEREEAMQASMMTTADQIVLEIGTSWTAIICKLFGSGAYALAPEGYMARMESLFAQLRPLAKERTDARVLLDEAQKMTQDQYEFDKDMLAAGGVQDGITGMSAFTLLKMRSKFINKISRGLVMKKMLENGVAALAVVRHKNETRRATLKQQIFIGVAADFFVSALLLIAFLWDITKRLKVLVANAERIPTGNALAERVSGSDELALLDGVLHNASGELASAKEYRKSLMEMVAHDLRSPLSSVKSTVDILHNPTVYGSVEQLLQHLGPLSFMRKSG
jgi:K+-sensing histidine kinase KdpD